MKPTTLRTLMTLAGTIAGAAVFVPQFAPYQTALASLASGLIAWAHGKRPGDEKAAPVTPRSGQ